MAVTTGPGVEREDFDASGGYSFENVIATLDGSGRPAGVSSSNPLPVSSSTAGTGATSQVTASNVAATLAIARATRRRLTIKNTDGSITVYIGPATVTSANGFPLLAGESITVTSTQLWQVIAASGSPVLAIADEF